MQKKILKNFIYIFCILLIGISSLFIIKDFINIPVGTDIYGYFFRTNTLYNALKNGHFYQIYTSYWYNGTELFRSWPPLVYYIHSFLTFFTNGDVFASYYIFIVFCFILSSIGFLLFANKENKFGLLFVISIFYFFMPENLRVLMSEGNIARVFLTAILPYLFFFVNDFLVYKKKKSLIGVSITLILITFTHFMIAAMCGISIFFICVFNVIITKDFKTNIYLLINSILSYIPTAIVLVPGLSSEILKGNNQSASSELAMWTESYSISLNPFYRLTDTSSTFYLGELYYSLVLFIFLIIALICFRKKSFPYFASSLLIFLLTSNALIPFFKMLPMSQLFWMQRLVPISYLFAFIGIIYWDNLRGSIITIFFILLAIDIVPSLNFFNYNKTDNILISNEINNELDEKVSEILLDKAIDVVSNRIAIIDESTFGPLPSFYLSKNINKGINFINGWGLQGSNIRDAIVRINESYKNGYFYYSFDRLIELGADTIIFRKDLISNEEYSSLKEIGEEMGYTLIDENDNAFLFKLKDVNTQFGTKTNYENICIGEDAYYISYLYPSFKEGSSNYIDDYSFDELKNYKKIYLAGFSYHNKTNAENLLTKLSKENVKIFIDMNHIPINKASGKNDFLGVTAQEISFTEKFPVLNIDGKQFKLDFQTSLYDSWRTVYLTGADKEINSSLYMTYPNLTYWGTDNSGNINFLGFNLVYYCVENKTDELISLFNEIFGLDLNSTSNREIIPIEVSYDLLNNNISITSNQDDVNTNLSFLDCFESDRQIQNEDKLVVVQKGTTNITIKYPMFKISLIISSFGCLILIMYWIFIHIFYKNKER